MIPHIVACWRRRARERESKSKSEELARVGASERLAAKRRSSSCPHFDTRTNDCNVRTR